MLWKGSASGRVFIGRNRTLVVGIFAIIAAVSIQSTLMDTWTVMQKCTERLVTRDGQTYNAFPPGGGTFYPGSTHTVFCNYQQDIGQDLIFWARIYVDADLLPMPTHLKITNPEGHTVFEKDFTSSIVIANIHPKLYGNYTAAISNTQDPAERVQPRGLGYHVVYAFGHLTSHYSGVTNPTGDLVSGALFWSYFLQTGGLILIVYWIARSGYRRMKNEHNIEPNP
jgi:hypothetical protein